MIFAALFLGASALALVWALASGRAPQAATPHLAEATDLHQQALQRPAIERLVMPTLTRMGAKFDKLMPGSRIQKMRRRINLAGKQNTWNVGKAMALKTLTSILGVVGGVALLATGMETLTIVGALLCVGIGFYAVDYYLDKCSSARQLEIQQVLPDMLDQISVCVEAGLGFDAAMQRVETTNDNVLSEEFGRTLQDFRLGLPRAKALYALLDRTDVADLRLFVRALVQAERSGIPIGHILRIQSDEIREKRRQAAEERAMKLPVKLVIPLVLCILPSLFTVILGPAVLRMVREGAV